MIEHPTITQAERTGYPVTQIRFPILICDHCREEIGAEFYGELDGRLICSDCAEDIWLELSPGEKLEKLGYNVECNI